MRQSMFSRQWCICHRKWFGHGGLCLQAVLVSWYGDGLLWVLAQCTAACLCVSLGDCSVAKSPLVAGISGNFKLSSGLHFETCNLL